MMKKTYLLFVVFLTFLLSIAPGANAQTAKQFARKFSLGKKHAAILIVGYSNDSKDIEKLLDLAITEAKRVQQEVDWRNSKSEVARLNNATERGIYHVSDSVFQIFQAASRLSQWTDGAFDITYSSPVGSYKHISLSPRNKTVKIKKKGLKFRFDPIVDGYVADFLVRYIYAAGMKNVLVKIGNVFRGLGSSLKGPWKVQIQDDAGTYAHRALNLSIKNTGAAIISRTQYENDPLINPRNKERIPALMRGTTIVMKEAALAQGIAHSLFVMGPEKGYEFLLKLNNARGLIVDDNGTFHRSPGF